MTLAPRNELTSRYHISADLVLETALHIGGGRNATTSTDSPIVRDGTGEPFIPGSSLKGAVRAAVERLVPNLKIKACCLTDQSSECLTALPPEHEKVNAYNLIRQAVGRRIVDRKPDDEYPKAFALLGVPMPKENEIVAEKALLQSLDKHLCQVCQTFGSPFISSVVQFHDAPIIAEYWIGLTQVRDGVGIDRDSERARDGIKYDFETVPPETRFRFKMTIENPAANDLALSAVGLSELANGMVPLGGIRSRGLGRCKLENVKVEYADFTKIDSLKSYLLGKPMSTQSFEKFQEIHLKTLFPKSEA